MGGFKPVSQFDWYQATVPAAPEALIRVLEGQMPHDVRRQVGPGFNSFKQRCDLVTIDGDQGEVLASVMYGGVNPHPNVKSTGDHSPALSLVLRELFPEHRISRLDVACDYRGADAFEDTIALMSRIGRAHSLKGEKIIPDDLDDGSTYYLGSRQSPLRLRCYEKGKQLFKLTGDPAWKQLFDWTRLELQVRPQRKFKSVAATMEPEAFWGCARWTREIADGVLNMAAEPVSMKPTRIHDQERAMRFSAAQYGPTHLRQIQRLGLDAYIEDWLQRIGYRQEREEAA